MLDEFGVSKALIAAMYNDAILETTDYLTLQRITDIVKTKLIEALAMSFEKKGMQ